MVYQALLKNLQRQERQARRSEWKSGFSEYTDSVLQLYLWNPHENILTNYKCKLNQNVNAKAIPTNKKMKTKSLNAYQAIRFTTRKVDASDLKM